MKELWWWPVLASVKIIVITYNKVVKYAGSPLDKLVGRDLLCCTEN